MRTKDTWIRAKIAKICNDMFKLKLMPKILKSWFHWMDTTSDKILKVFLSHKNQDKNSFLCKISYINKIFDILLNLDPRQEDKNKAKSK